MDEEWPTKCTNQQIKCGCQFFFLFQSFLGIFELIIEKQPSTSSLIGWKLWFYVELWISTNSSSAISIGCFLSLGPIFVLMCHPNLQALTMLTCSSHPIVKNFPKGINTNCTILDLHVYLDQIEIGSKSHTIMHVETDNETYIYTTNR